MMAEDSQAAMVEAIKRQAASLYEALECVFVCSDNRMKALGITSHNNHQGIKVPDMALAKDMDIISVKGSFLDISLAVESRFVCQQFKADEAKLKEKADAALAAEAKAAEAQAEKGEDNK